VHNKTIHIMHVLGNLGRGGAEVGVVRLIQSLSDERFHHSITIIGSDLSLLDEYSLDVPCHSLNIQTRSYTAFWKLAKLFRQERVDLVHVNNLSPWFDTALAAKLVGAKCIQTFHGVEQGTLKFSFLRKFLFKMANSLTSEVTAVAPEAAELLCRLIGLSADRVMAIPNGVDTEYFSPVLSNEEKYLRRNDVGLPTGVLLFGCVAALRPVKNHQGLLRSFCAAIKQVDTPAALVLVGDGPLWDELRTLANELNISDRVHFLGRRTDIVKLLQCFDSFVLNSDTEGLSYAVLEAMSCGLPFIGTAVGANTRLVSDGVQGKLVPAGDSRVLSEVLLQVLENPTKLAGMGSAAREIVVSQYGIETMVNCYRSVYRRLC